MRSRIPAATALAAALAATTSAHAFEIKHADGGALVRWKRSRVVWTVDASVKDVPGGQTAVTAAVKAWTERAGAPKLAVKTGGKALEPGVDGTNAILYAKDGFAPAGVALAVTVLSFDDATGEVLDADIILNGKYEIGKIAPGAVAPASKDDPGGETYDVNRILAHEMGHGLGLSDELVRKDALMYPYVARAVALAAAPGTDDLAGLESLYGEPSAPSVVDGDQPGCGGAVVARTGPRSAPAGALCAAGLMIAALIMARSTRRGGRGAAACSVVAAVVLVLPPSTSTSTSTSGTDGVVANVTTTSINGIFRSEVEVATACGAGRCVERRFVWGGRLGGIRQVIGGTHVPVAGDRVARDGAAQ